MAEPEVYDQLVKEIGDPIAKWARYERSLKGGTQPPAVKALPAKPRRAATKAAAGRPASGSKRAAPRSVPAPGTSTHKP